MRQSINSIYPNCIVQHKQEEGKTRNKNLNFLISAPSNKHILRPFFIYTSARLVMSPYIVLLQYSYLSFSKIFSQVVTRMRRGRTKGEKEDISRRLRRSFSLKLRRSLLEGRSSRDDLNKLASDDGLAGAVEGDRQLVNHLACRS